jgi:hypothetical protein
MAGTVLAPRLSAKPLTVNGGIFQLFVVNPDQVETRNMRYRMTLLSEEGKRWYFDGFKVVHRGPVNGHLARHQHALHHAARERRDRSRGGPGHSAH